VSEQPLLALLFFLNARSGGVLSTLEIIGTDPATSTPAEGK
jgi:hypothetical protein